METLIIAALIFVGLVFFLIEVFLIPGISIAGILSAISLIYACFYAFTNLGTTAGLITIGVSGLGVIAGTIWFMKSKTVDKLSLHKTLDFKIDQLKDISIHVGDKGTTITRLTLIGNADFNGNILEVKSADGFIDEQCPVEVCRIQENTIYVKPIK